MVIERSTVVLIGTLPKLTLVGSASLTLMPVPLTGMLIGMHDPPANGHSNMTSVPLDALAAVGVKLSIAWHVPGPGNPPFAPHASKLKWNGALRPLPDASCRL